MSKNEKDIINQERRKALTLLGAAGAGLLLSPILTKAFSLPETVVEAGSGVETASYIIFQENGMIYAKNGKTGKIEFSGADAATVIQSAINALTNGGKIFIKAGTYTLTAPLLFDDGDYMNKEWILSGEGIATKFYCNTANVNAIEIKNATRVTLENFRIECGSSGGHGIALINDPSDLASIRRGKLSNLVIEVSNPSKHALYMVNPIDSYFEHLRLVHQGNTGTGVPLWIENNSTTTHYGNSEFTHIVAYVLSGHDGVNIVGTNHHLNLVNFNYLSIEQGSNPTGTQYGLKIGSNVDRVSFNFLSCEGFDEGVFINGTSGTEPSNIHVKGGYILSDVKAIHCGYYTIACTFEKLHLNVPAGQTLIHDEQDYRIANVYKDLYWEGDRTITIDGSNPGAELRGRAGNYKYFENSGTATITSGTTSVTVDHNLVSTPRKVIVTPRGNIGSVWVSARTSTQITINCSTAPTTNTIVDWYAEV
jgi:hypothetical protein